MCLSLSRIRRAASREDERRRRILTRLSRNQRPNTKTRKDENTKTGKGVFPLIGSFFVLSFFRAFVIQSWDHTTRHIGVSRASASMVSRVACSTCFSQFVESLPKA